MRVSYLPKRAWKSSTNSGSTPVESVVVKAFKAVFAVLGISVLTPVLQPVRAGNDFSLRRERRVRAWKRVRN